MKYKDRCNKFSEPGLLLIHPNSRLVIQCTKYDILAMVMLI